MSKLLKILAFFFAIMLVSCSFNGGQAKIEEPEDESGTEEYSDADSDPQPASDTDENETADEDIPASDSDEQAGDNEKENGDSDDETADSNDSGDGERPDDDEYSGEKIDSVVIGTYNTHLFFDTVCDSGDCGGYSFEEKPSESSYRTKVSDLAKAVKKIDADIILLQEVEKASCLEDLFDALGGKYDDLYLGEKGSLASVDTAVMTKGKITYKNKHTAQIDCPECEGGKTTFARAFLEIHIELGGRNIIVFSAHFISKNSSNGDESDARRAAEGRAAARILEETAEKYPDALIVMGGDLNDTPGSDTLKPLESSDMLLRVAEELSYTDQATYYYNEPIALDHLFMALNHGGSYVKGSAEVIKDAPSWYELDPSDHASLRAEFAF